MNFGLIRIGFVLLFEKTIFRKFYGKILDF